MQLKLDNSMRAADGRSRFLVSSTAAHTHSGPKPSLARWGFVWDSLNEFYARDAT